MVNLLPTKELKSVQWEHRRRGAVVALIFASCCAVLLLLFTVPSAIVVWSGVSGFQQQLSATKKLVDIQRKQGGGDMLSMLQERADILETALSRRTPTSILEDIAPRIPDGVRVQQFSYGLGEETVLVTLSGTAATRAALTAFGTALRQSSLFSRVDVPVSSLAKSENIDFTLTLSLKREVALEVEGVSPPTTAGDENATSSGISSE